MLPLLAVFSADALTCFIEAAPTFYHLGSGLPRNTRPLIRTPDHDTPITMTDEHGAPVAFTQQRGQGLRGDIVEVIPEAPLAASTTYTLTAGDHARAFSTGSTLDEAAPSGGTLESWAWDGPMLGSEWAYIGRDLRVWLTFTEATDDSPVLWQLQASHTPDFTGPTFTLLSDDPPFVGHGDCTADTLSPITPGDPVYFRTRMRDVAGNLTTWSTPQRVITGREPSSWHVADQGDGGILLALPICFLGLIAAGVTAQTGRYTENKRRLLKTTLPDNRH